MDAQETKVFVLVLILVGVIGIILTSFFVTLQRQHKKILALKRQNSKADLNSIERDRARIAADLHDELSPMLSAVKLKVSSFELHDQEDLRQQEKTDEHLEDILQRLRVIAYNLMPVTLKRKGLKAALQEFTGYVSKTGSLQIDLFVEDISFKEEQSVHLYRIVQEIVHNTIKHAGATLLRISLKQEKKMIIFSSRDNGQGFDYEQKLTAGNGFGLHNLLSRTDVLGGDLFIDSKADTGTAYTIELPVNIT